MADFSEEYLKSVIDNIIAKNKWKILSVPCQVADRMHFISLSRNGKLTPMVGFENVMNVICEDLDGKTISFSIVDGDKPIIIEKESKDVHKTGR